MPSSSGLRDWATIGQIVSAACDRFADREAIVDGPVRLTYVDTAASISRMVQVFRGLGLVKGDTVAVLSPNRHELLLVIAAAGLMGMRFTALRALGSEDDHAFILRDADACLLIVDPNAFGDRAMALSRRDDAVHRTVALGSADFADDLLALMAGHDAQPLADEAGPDDVCAILYTGGTTGRPKGVVHTHSSFVAFNMLEMLEWEWPSNLRFLAASPITHAAISWILPTFLRGGTYVVNQGFSPERFLRTVESEAITMSFVVPTMLYALLDYPHRADFDTSSLDNVLYGAAPMSPVRLIEALETFGPVFSQLYGQTEGPTVLAYLPKGDHDPARPDLLQSCGYPTRGLTIRLLDGQGLEVPVGEVGEICARGPLIMREYLNQPDATAEALTDGWLHTGDLARRDAQGRLYIAGRLKDMVISGGFNVYPKEVEDALALHPAVACSAVIGVPDPVWGEMVTAIVVLREGHEAEKADLAAFVKAKKGSDYAPKRIEFVDEIPVTALGKFDKEALKRQFRPMADTGR
jgi:fatty-acyl-CoA synthase